MRHFQVIVHLEKPGAARLWAAGVAREEDNPIDSSDGVGWVYNLYGQEAQEEVLV